MDIYERAIRCRQAMVNRAFFVIQKRDEAELIADQALANFTESDYSSDSGSLRSYLRTAARNLAINYQRDITRARRTSAKPRAYCFACPGNIADGVCEVLGPYYPGMIKECTLLGYKYGSLRKGGQFGIISEVSMSQPVLANTTPEQILATPDLQPEPALTFRPLTHKELLILILGDLNWATAGVIDKPMTSAQVAETFNRIVFAPALDYKPMTADNVRYIQGKLKK